MTELRIWGRAMAKKQYDTDFEREPLLLCRKWAVTVLYLPTDVGEGSTLSKHNADLTYLSSDHCDSYDRCSSVQADDQSNRQSEETL